MNKFYLVNWGTDDFDYSFLTVEEWQQNRDGSADGLVSCKDVSAIYVASTDAAQEWQNAYSDYVHAVWSPNQTREDKQENAPIIAQARATMKRLEQEAQSTVA